ncbi:MAG: L,D-transpeptidase [Chloroflexi bacterium]|nr:L,D-transpeptidase [Chloroflexota bacterium]
MSAISRRSFLQLTGLSLGAAAFAPPPPEALASEAMLARVTARTVAVRARPDEAAPQLAGLTRDAIVAVEEETWSATGPRGNPYWFRIKQGFVHAGDMQPVRSEMNEVAGTIPSEGLLVEVTVPFTQTRVKPSAEAEPLYRLYYEAAFWAVAAVEDSSGSAWYALLDDRLDTRYYVRAEHLRPIRAEDLSPIAPEVPLEAKRVEVDLASQELTAFEYERAVFTTRISGGRLRSDPQPGQGHSFTPIGEFHVNQKVPSRHMGDARLTADLFANEQPGVPWVSYFTYSGIAFHGVYWHNDFGRRRSVGCINMRPAEARWIYRWTAPAFPLMPFSPHATGTRVIVTE